MEGKGIEPIEKDVFGNAHFYDTADSVTILRHHADACGQEGRESGDGAARRPRCRPLGPSHRGDRLRHTSLGIAIHAAGVEPRAVDKSGVSVTWIRYMGVFFAGFMSALASAFLSIGDIHTFTEGMTRGAGYLAIAAVIFGKWTVGGTVLACLLFGAATAMQFQLPTLGINVPNAFLIMLPYNQLFDEAIILERKLAARGRFDARATAGEV